jgi:RNA-directed DNA polymerase
VLEDKIVQRVTVAGLNGIYETDFLGFSYGYRPGEGQHNACMLCTPGADEKGELGIGWRLTSEMAK